MSAPSPPRAQSALPDRHSPVRAWAVAHPVRADAIFGAVMAAASIVTEHGVPLQAESPLVAPDLLSGVLGVLAGAGVALRRRHVVLAVLLSTGAATVYTLQRYPGPAVLFTVLITLYSAAAHGSRKESRFALAATLGALTLWMVVFFEEMEWVNILSNFAVFSIPWFLGDNLRIRRVLEHEAREQAQRAEEARVEAEERAVAAERARIARELHDVVAHSMGVMVLQATGARRIADRKPEQVAEALEAIETTGRTALGEMRRLVGVLRETAGLADRAPQPGLGMVPDLIASLRSGPLTISLSTTGQPTDLPAGLDLAAFRVVQEALTNAQRHAGPARVQVSIDHGADTLHIRVTDDGRGAAADPRSEQGTGHGLVGMRERVMLYGGTLRAGPRPGGGFEIHAVFPLES